MTVELPPETLAQLAEFEAKYAFYPASHEDLGDGRTLAPLPRTAAGARAPRLHRG